MRDFQTTLLFGVYAYMAYDDDGTKRQLNTAHVVGRRYRRALFSGLCTYIGANNIHRVPKSDYGHNPRRDYWQGRFYLNTRLLYVRFNPTRMTSATRYFPLPTHNRIFIYATWTYVFRNNLAVHFFFDLHLFPGFLLLLFHP